MQRLKGLDALRGIAALAVLSYHDAAVFGIGGQPNGYLAVDFFFMLSGFVIAGVLQKGTRRPVEFLQWRYKRFWLTMAIGSVLGVMFVPGPSLWQVVPGFLLLPLLAGGPVFPFNPSEWSIFFELCANAVHSIIGRNFWLVVFTVSLIWLLFSGGFGGGPDTGNFVRGLPRVFLSYSLGVMMFQRWGDAPPIKLPAACGLLLVTLLLPWRSVWFDFGFVLLLCPLAIMSGIRGTLPFAEQLGALSFPLYAVHYPVLLAAKSAGAGPAAASIAAITTAALIGWCGTVLTAVRAGSGRRLAKVNLPTF